MALGTRQLERPAPPQQKSAGEPIFSEQQLDSLKAAAPVLKELSAIFKNDPGATATPNAGVQHGLTPGAAAQMGLFSAPGVTPQMFSTLVRANGAFEALLPMVKTIYYQTQREIRTGVNNGASGSYATDFCGTPPNPGNMKVCQQVYQFGDVLMGTETVQIPRVGEYYNLADQNRQLIPVDDLSAMNDPFAFDGLINASDPNTQTYRTIFDLYIQWQRQIRQAVWQGNPAVGNNDLNFFLNGRAFSGLDQQIKTGYTDVVSGQTCSAVDSEVRSFGGTNITGTNGTWGTIVEALTDLHTYLMLNSENMGYDLQSSTWAFVMHPRLFRPLTRQWPCSYYTTGCNLYTGNTNDTGKRVNIDAATQRQMQETMFQGRYLMIDGISIPVLQSWGIPCPSVANNQYASSIYLVPLRLNGVPTVFFEYFDMGNAMMEEFDKLGGLMTQSVSINNGLYRMGVQSQPFCKKYLFAARMRLLLTAPFASARLDGVVFNDNQHIRSPFPGDTMTYKDGGRTYTPQIYG